MKQSKLPPGYTTERFTPGRFEEKHSVKIRGVSVPFQTIGEDCLFYSESGEAEASVFSFSYMRTEAESKGRPVMFFWNGGPGSATSTLHLECFGPWQMDRDESGKPVYGLKEDGDCLLDICDLVFVDPVGVGYSRLLDPGKREKYYSVDGDARSTAFFIVQWIKKYNRWDSPLYLCGESYGTVRACRVLAELGRSPYSESRMVLGIPVAGAVLIGLATSEDESGRPMEPGLDLVTAMMPSMAAVNWYHHPEGKGRLEGFVEEAWSFVKGELLSALFEGDSCQDERVRELSGKLAFYTGMEKEYFVRNSLRLESEEDFMLQVAVDKGGRADIYDGRQLTSLQESYNSIGNENVPLAVMNGLLAPKLGIHMERLYYTGNLTVYPLWNFETEEVEDKRTHIQCLKAAMESNPQMHLLMASGLYDLCTFAGNTRYVLSHSGLPMERVTAREYAGGHGVYSSEEGKRQFLQDVRKMLTERKIEGMVPGQSPESEEVAVGERA